MAALRAEGAATRLRGDGDASQVALLAVALLGTVGLAMGINRYRLRAQQKQDLAAFDAAVSTSSGSVSVIESPPSAASST